MADGTHAHFSSPSRLAHIRLKVRELVWETRFFARLGQTWSERMSIAKLMAILYTARLMPFKTHRWETTILVRGATYVVGVRTSEIFIFHEIYESLQYNRHADFIPQSGWTVFDVGANIGVFTVLQATQGARIYSFEPNPDSYSRLSRNVTANKLSDRVRLFPTALGDERGVGSLHVTGGGTTGGVVTPVEADASASGVAVPIATLDEVVSTLPGLSIDLLKIDAEGSEVAILRGGERTLDHVQRIMVEYHSRDLLRQVREILARKGFAQEMIVDYYAEDAAAGQDEVGILYARRSDSNR
jgi:FkbM family methyltransferase